MKFISILLILASIYGLIQSITHTDDDAKRLAKHTHAIMAAARNAHRHHRNPHKAAVRAAHQIKKAGQKSKHHHHDHHHHSSNSNHHDHKEHSPRAAVEAATKYAKRHGKDAKKAGENAIRAIRKRSKKLRNKHNKD